MAYAIGDKVTFDDNLVEDMEYEGEVIAINKAGSEDTYLVSVSAIGKVVEVDSNGEPV